MFPSEIDVWRLSDDDDDDDDDDDVNGGLEERRGDEMRMRRDEMGG